MPVSFLKQLSELNFWKNVLNHFSSGFYFVGGAIVSGVIGNRADDGFINRLLPWMGQPIEIQINAWILLSVSLVLFTLFAFLQWCFRNKVRLLESAGEVLSGFNKLDDGFLLLLPQLSVCDQADAEVVLERLIESYLASIPKIFDDHHPDDYQLEKCSIVIYRPAQNDPQSLVYWHGFNESSYEKKIKFPIGPTLRRGEKYGIPGIVFLADDLDCIRTAQLEKKHSVEKEHPVIWKATDENHRFYLNDPTRTPPHRALAAISIIDSEKNKLGVLCFYTSNKNAFRNIAITKKLLRIFATRLSVAIQIAEHKQDAAVGEVVEMSA